MILLERTGHAPLAFDGALLGQATTNNTRGTHLTIYRTTGGTWVGHCHYRSLYEPKNKPREPDHYTAYTAPSGQELQAQLTTYDPVDHLLGYPPGDQYRERQERLKAELRAQYQETLSRALRLAGVTESID